MTIALAIVRFFFTIYDHRFVLNFAEPAILSACLHVNWALLFGGVSPFKAEDRLLRPHRSIIDLPRSDTFSTDQESN
jgi:hypothetical protein